MTTMTQTSPARSTTPDAWKDGYLTGACDRLLDIVSDYALFGVAADPPMSYGALYSAGYRAGLLHADLHGHPVNDTPNDT
jgi:hypothetical protein